MPSSTTKLRENAQKWNEVLRNRIPGVTASRNYRRKRIKLIAIIIFGIVECCRNSFLSTIITTDDINLIRSLGGIFRPVGHASKAACIAITVYCFGGVLL